MRAILVLLVLLLLGCYNKDYIRYNENDHRYHLSKFAHIDSSFSLEDRQTIQISLAQWTTVTNNMVGWTVAPWEMPQSDPTGLDCFTHLYIYNVNLWDERIIKIENSIGFSIRGYFLGSSARCGAEAIYIVRNRINSQNELRLITLHEIGHSFGLDHNTGHSIMNAKKIDKGVEGITSDDVKDFCQIWRC